MVWCTVLKYINDAEAGATEATPQQVGGHARAMNLADLAAVDGGCATSCPGRLEHRQPPRLFGMRLELSLNAMIMCFLC